jgi:hypothetical protein
MDFFEEVALAERQRLAEPSSTMPIQATDQLVALLEVEPLSGLFGSLPLVACEPAVVQVLDPTALDQPDAPPAPVISAVLPLDDVGSAGETGELAAAGASDAPAVGDAQSGHVQALPAMPPADEENGAALSQEPSAEIAVDPGCHAAVSASSPEANHEIPGDATAGVPHGGAGFSACWRRLRAAHQQAMHLDQACRADADLVFGSSVSVTEARNLDRVRRELLGLLVAKAAHTFAVPGVSLNINVLDVQEALGVKADFHPQQVEQASWRYMDREERRAKKWLSMEEIEEDLCNGFDPDAVWSYLESKYGGPAGEHLAHQQIASALCSELQLHKRPPEEQKGKLLISCYAGSEKGFRSSVRRYTYSTVEKLRKLRNDLAVFAEWAGDTPTAAAIAGDRCATLETHGELVSRSKARFGSIEWTFYNERVEIRFTAELGMKFRMFMAEFGPRPDAC